MLRPTMIASATLKSTTYHAMETPSHYEIHTRYFRIKLIRRGQVIPGRACIQLYYSPFALIIPAGNWDILSPVEP